MAAYIGSRRTLGSLYPTKPQFVHRQHRMAIETCTEGSVYFMKADIFVKLASIKVSWRRTQFVPGVPGEYSAIIEKTFVLQMRRASELIFLIADRRTWRARFVNTCIDYSVETDRNTEITFHKEPKSEIGFWKCHNYFHSNMFYLNKTGKPLELRSTLQLMRMHYG